MPIRRSWYADLPPELKGVEMRWWLPEGAAEPIRTERGPLSIPEKQALWSYYAKRTKAASEEDTRVLALVHGLVQ